MSDALRGILARLSPDKRAVLADLLWAEAEPMAIVGMGCRFPGGAHNPAQFWELLQHGREALMDVPADRWDMTAFYDPDPGVPGKSYVRQGGFLPDLSLFDADFFGISPREALRLDPQQRLLLETTWEAVEEAGLAADALAGSATGVFIGMTNNQHILRQVMADATFYQDPFAGIGSDCSAAAGRLAYTFDFRGPTISLDTACSSSLVALHLACRSLRHKECNLAVVGGVYAVMMPQTFIVGCRMGMFSPDGRCKTFDAGADGYGLGEGCGIVLVRRLSDALANGDQIKAIIRGTAVNEDGRSNGLTAPNGLSQQHVIRQALRQAGVAPHLVSYVEAHGTGTPMGDPIEVESVQAVLYDGRPLDHPLWIGSVKTNIGHLYTAAGIAGLIKTVLALQHQAIPPHLHFAQPNPAIAWDDRLQTPTQLTPWLPIEGRRIAGVSSFGWSGTNAHVILEEAPARQTATAARPYLLLPLSARTPAALEAATTALHDHIQAHPDINMTNLAYTLQTGRQHFTYRRALLCRDREEALRLLAAPHQAVPERGPGTPVWPQPDHTDTDPLLTPLPAPKPLLETIATTADQWLSGFKPDWSALYDGGEKPQRISLPTYPFTREPYWVGPPTRQFVDEVTAVPPPTPLQQPFAEGALPRRPFEDWFYLPGWQQAAPHPPILPDEAGNWLLFLDEAGLGQQIAAWLRQQRQQVITVRAGQQWEQTAADAYVIRPSHADDYHALLQSYTPHGRAPTHIVHLWTVSAEAGDDGQQALDDSFYSLLYLVQALGQLNLAARLSVITSHTHRVSGDEPLSPDKATILGPCRSIPLEYEQLSCRLVDVCLPVNGREQQALLSNLMGELAADFTEPVVALRREQRWLQTFTPVKLPPLAAAAPPILRQKGTYLITGGLGGLGLAVADYLVKTVQANVVLLGRSALPPRYEWPSVLAASQNGHGPGHKIRQIQQLETAGGHVLYLAADVSDEQQMVTAVQQTLTHFGAIHGVIHAAGTPGKGLIQFKTPETAAPVLAPKVNGTLVLERALQAIDLDFFVLFSSIASLTAGGPGQADYAAANAFLDAHARQCQGQKRFTAVINWGEWQWNAWEGELAGFSPDVQTFFRRNRAEFGIEAGEGVAALARILGSHYPQVIVSTQDFPRLAQAARQLTIANLMTHREQASTDIRHSRPVLGITYVPPRNELERMVTAVWEEALRLTGIGIDDNFFELGGNSLIGLNLVKRLQQTLARPQIPDRVLYEAPSIRALAQLLSQDQQADAALVDSQHARGLRRRQQYAGRLQKRLNHG